MAYKKVKHSRNGKVKTNSMASSELEFNRDIYVRTLLSDEAFADRRTYNTILAKRKIRKAQS